MEQRIFDTHAHYDHPLFRGDGPQMVKRLFDDGVLDGVVIPAITFESNYHREQFPEEEFPNVYFAAGLHPKCATNESFFDEARRREIDELIADKRTVALKTGLDFCKKALTDAQKEHQKRFFRYFIEKANETKLPLVLHIRNAADSAVEVMESTRVHSEAVAHCFCGDIETAIRLSNAGVTHIGVGGMLTRPENEAFRECVKMLPTPMLLLETDAPFVRPADYAESLNDSRSLMGIVKLLADLREVSVEWLIRALNQNARDFYKL